MPPTFDERVAECAGRMGPAQRRVARFFRNNREEVLIASAAALAGKTGTSDATIVRTARALGFPGLDDLRRAIAGELRQSLSPAGRLTRTLGAVGSSLSAALDTTLAIHIESLENLRGAITPDLFEKAVTAIVGARRILVFGLGPSSAIASYLVIQLARFGFDAQELAQAGLLFADDLRKLRAGDLVFMLAYGRVYAELAVLLDEIERHGAGSLLLTDTLAAQLGGRVDLLLPVARGRADMLSMHTATLGLIEALLVGVAAARPQQTLASLGELNAARERLAGEAAQLPASQSST